MPPKKVKAGKRKSGGQPAQTSPVKKNKKQQEDESEEDSDEEEEEVEVPKKKAAAKAAPKKGKGKKAKQEEEEEEEDSDDSEEEEAPVNGKKAAKKAPAKADEESDDDEDESEEEEKPKAKGKAAAEEGSDDDDDEEEAPEKAEDDSDDDDEDDEEDEDSDSKKRKKAQKEKPAKKARTEDPVSLFVGNVGEMDEEKIGKFFKKHEIMVAEVRLIGKKGNCFVDLEDSDDLDKALELNGEKLGSNALSIEKAKPRNRGADGPSPKSDDDTARDAATLFVKNLPFSASEEDLQGMFDGCTEVRLPRSNGQSKGFAFVQFDSADDVKSAIEEKQGCELQGRQLFLDIVGQKRDKRQSFGATNASSKGEAGKTKVLFVKNLPYTLSGEGLQEHFESCKSARIATFSDTGKPRGFGFVEFDSADDCKNAYDSMQEYEIDGRRVTLDYASELGDRDRGSRGGGRGFGGGGGRGFGGGGRGFGGRGRGGDRDRGRGGRGGRGFGGRGGGFRGGRDRY